MRHSLPVTIFYEDNQMTDFATLQETYLAMKEVPSAKILDDHRRGSDCQALQAARLFTLGAGDDEEGASVDENIADLLHILGTCLPSASRKLKIDGLSAFAEKLTRPVHWKPTLRHKTPLGGRVGVALIKFADNNL